MLLGNIIATIVRLLWPGAPRFLPDFVATLVPLVIDLVTELSNEKLDGAEKFQEAMDSTKVILDDSFDLLPEWSEVPEEKRDLIIAGLIELVYFIVSVAGKPGGKRALRGVAKALRHKD